MTFPPCIKLELETPAEVSVHLVQIGNQGGAMTHRRSALATLSTAERERAERFVRPGIRGRYIYTRATLRRLLAERLNTKPELLAFEQTPQGRPFLSASNQQHPLDFNVSHSGDLALIAIGSDQHRIGVDIEQQKEMRDLDQLAARVLTAGELATLNQYDDQDPKSDEAKLAQFFRYWTCKEAYLKALGTGLQIDMKRIEAQLTEPNGFKYLKLPGRAPQTTLGFTPAPNHQAALVLLGSE